MQTKNQIKYEGIPVNYYFFPNDEKYISHAEFRLTNNANSNAEIQFYKCELSIDGKDKSMETFNVYSDDVLVTGKLSLKANSAVKIKITFPFVYIQYIKFKKMEIHSHIISKTRHIKAISGINVFYENNLTR
jgi:hypothetical protein